MTPDRLRQIEELFHAVRERPAVERAALLAKADARLRREVESRLAREGENLLTVPAAVPDRSSMGWDQAPAFPEIAALAAQGTAQRGRARAWTEREADRSQGRQG
ncbi:MAG TPA: hypothetical protein VGH38_03785 [Bryobacteraceae bacterium]